MHKMNFWIFILLNKRSVKSPFHSQSSRFGNKLFSRTVLTNVTRFEVSRIKVTKFELLSNLFLIQTLKIFSSQDLKWQGSTWHDSNRQGSKWQGIIIIWWQSSKLLRNWCLIPVTLNLATSNLATSNLVTSNFATNVD